MTAFTTTGRDLRALLAPVLPFVGPADFPALQSIHVTVTDTQLVAAATDRFRIGVVRRPLALPDAEETPAVTTGDFLIGARDAKRVLDLFKATRYDNPTIRVTVEDLDSESGSTVTVENISGFDGIDTMRIRFTGNVSVPSWPTGIYKIVAEACARRETDDIPIGLNADLLADFKHAVEHGEALTLHRGLHSKPVGVTCGEHFAGAIMPRLLVSGDGTGDALAPAWTELLDSLSTTKDTKEAAA